MQEFPIFDQEQHVFVSLQHFSFDNHASTTTAIMRAQQKLLLVHHSQPSFQNNLGLAYNILRQRKSQYWRQFFRQQHPFIFLCSQVKFIQTNQHTVVDHSPQGLLRANETINEKNVKTTTTVKNPHWSETNHLATYKGS